jgi:S-adenosylmethionine:tRNA ribosyltransferase-isomerase
MRRSDFAYDLPDELIAQHPPAERAGGRLLEVLPEAVPGAQSGHTGTRDLQFSDFPSLLHPDDLLVFNDTRVIPARVFGSKPTGGQVEILLERLLGERRILAHVGSSKALRSEVPIALPGDAEARFISRHGDLFELELDTDPLDYFEAHGSMPLPPYIERAAGQEDVSRYQTVYAREAGAVAAPTAGLHFDDKILSQCAALGVRTAFVTLHVGAGTFQSVRVDNLDEHRMHAERVTVGAATCDAIATTRQRGGRVIAIGTTVVRSLETAGSSGIVQPFSGETAIFIRPGYRFNAVDALLTNFHLPESTLLMLVTAFGGFDTVMAAYRHAVRERYRFFSYGDAMFLSRSG